MCDAHVTEVVYGEDELVPEQAEADGTGDEPAVLVGIGGGGSQEEVADDLWAVAGEITRLVEAGVDDALVERLVCGGMAGLLLGGQSGGGRLKGSGGGAVGVEKGAVLVDEKDLGGEAGGGGDGLRLVVPDEGAIRGEGADPAGHDGGEEGLPWGVDGADGVAPDRAEGVLGVVRVDLVCGVAADKVEDCECAAGVGGEPGVGDAEEEVAVDDEGVAGEDAGGDVCAGPADKAHARVGWRRAYKYGAV